ncbi:hypothetical protein FQ154_01745 [Paeniglutamicibacter gangotriensis]|uniref:Uncharacterized protein n=1 Tax=Paeniglutamicibacter gangotriensis TaxID=254787 RepID=A0A5B0EMN4_9MICC|nr:hypothetical protein [Paeniglutamicibacter gangotriensis]KAA0979908.1 hypothetical protein FQ154_01745 [Paeniglutamicibacter gangotriensis]
MSLTQVTIPAALATERLTRAVHAARRTVRRAALHVDTVTFTGGDVHAAIEDVVRAGTALEQAEAELAAVEVAA